MVEFVAGDRSTQIQERGCGVLEDPKTFAIVLLKTLNQISSTYHLDPLLHPGQVLGVCKDLPASYDGRSCFGLRTERGMLEFDCESKICRQRWIDAVEALLSLAGGLENSLKIMRIT